MQVERQDRRTVADQNLGGQTIAVSPPAHRLNREAGKIFVTGRILERPALGAGAADQHEPQNQNAALKHRKSVLITDMRPILFVLVAEILSDVAVRLKKLSKRYGECFGVNLGI